MLWENSADADDDIFLNIPRKQDLTLHANIILTLNFDIVKKKKKKKKHSDLGCKYSSYGWTATTKISRHIRIHEYKCNTIYRGAWLSILHNFTCIQLKHYFNSNLIAY